MLIIVILQKWDYFVDKFVISILGLNTKLDIKFEY